MIESLFMKLTFLEIQEIHSVIIQILIITIIIIIIIIIIMLIKIIIKIKTDYIVTFTESLK